MTNPTAQVPSAVTPFSETVFKWPVIGGATVAKTYYTGELIGKRADGYCGSFDDTVAMTFLGVCNETVPFEVNSGHADGDRIMNIDRPHRIHMPLDSSTVSRVTNFGQKLYAADS